MNSITPAYAHVVVHKEAVIGNYRILASIRTSTRNVGSDFRGCAIVKQEVFGAWLSELQNVASLVSTDPSSCLRVVLSIAVLRSTPTTQLNTSLSSEHPSSVENEVRPSEAKTCVFSDSNFAARVTLGPFNPSYTWHSVHTLNVKFSTSNTVSSSLSNTCAGRNDTQHAVHKSVSEIDSRLFLLIFPTSSWASLHFFLLLWVSIISFFSLTSSSSILFLESSFVAASVQSFNIFSGLLG